MIEKMIEVKESVLQEQELFLGAIAGAVLTIMRASVKVQDPEKYQQVDNLIHAFLDDLQDLMESDSENRWY